MRQSECLQPWLHPDNDIHFTMSFSFYVNSSCPSASLTVLSFEVCLHADYARAYHARGYLPRSDGKQSGCRKMQNSGTPEQYTINYYFCLLIIQFTLKVHAISSVCMVLYGTF